MTRDVIVLEYMFGHKSHNRMVISSILLTTESFNEKNWVNRKMWFVSTKDL